MSVEDILVIPPQWVRKNKIIIKATFNDSYENWGEVDETIAMLLWSFWMFE